MCRNKDVRNYSVIKLNDLDKKEAAPPAGAIVVVAGLIGSVFSYTLGFIHGKRAPVPLNPDETRILELEQKIREMEEQRIQTEGFANYDLASTFLSPIIIVGATSLALRATALGLGAIAKVSSRWAEKHGYDELSVRLNVAEYRLNTFARRSIKTELKIAEGLILLRVGAFALPALYNGSPGPVAQIEPK